MAPHLALYLLSSPQLYLDKTLVSLERRKSLALLVYLAIEQGWHRRESLSSLLWPDYNQASAFKNLRQVLWEIQGALGDGWLSVDREIVCLNDSKTVWLDIREFDSRISQAASQEDRTLRLLLLEEAAKLYRNHFLTGFSLKDAYSFNDWAYTQAEEQQRKLSQLLVRLSEEYCASGEARQAVPHARRLVSIDPLDEAAQRLLMEVYLQAGQPNAALKQYQDFEQLLRKELNLDPQPETRELHKKIRKGEIKPAPVERQVESILPGHNLPHSISTFIGRGKEQNEVTQLLTNKRLVTLVGAGGIGKTSLSLQVGQRLLKEFPQGVWFIALDSLSDPALITQTVASLFDLREGGNRSLLNKLTDLLRDRATLLIFDNCEHLLDGCVGLITGLLAHCADLKVLATSRESLGIPGEAIYTMPSLPLPEGDSDILEELSEFESIQLFAERASLALPSFHLSKDNIQAVVEICRKVDGIPLAIELAAARVNILQVEEILEQLQQSFALLSSDSRTILPRQQTIRGSMDWSWGLLSEAEQTLLRQLSVFAGGWTLEAAQMVCDRDVLELFAVLVKKSLIVVEQGIGHGTRYYFHELVRQYAHEHLIRTGEEETTRNRHMRYFVDLAEQAERELRGPALVDWMDRLSMERNNIRAALHWADKTDVEAGLYLSSRLIRYWESINLPEGERWLKTFIQKPESNDHPRARAQVLLAYGWLLTWLQKFDEAHRVTDESMALFRRAEDREGEVDALILLENILQFKDQTEPSREMGRRALALAQSLEDPWREANSLNYLGWGYNDQPTRFAHWEKAIQLYRQVGDHINLANMLGLLGQFQVVSGDIETGEKNLEEAMVYWQANKKANVWENPKIAKSLIALHYGRYEEAQALLEQVMRSAEETGNRMSYLWAQVRIGYVAYQAGNLVEARRLLGESARSFAVDGYSVGAVFALEGLAGLSATVGKMEEAARLIGYADVARERLSDQRPPHEQADMDLSIAACVARIGKEAFSDAYEAGKSMSLDEIVTYVVKEG